MQAVINVAIAPLTTNPALWAQNPQQSRLVDELLLGMPVEITGEAEQHMVPVRTFYGYTGWVAQDALLTGPKAEDGWFIQVRDKPVHDCCPGKSHAAVWRIGR